MAETESTQDNISYMRTQLDGVARMVKFSLRSNPQAREEARSIFRERAGSPQLYLALGNGPKTQTELKTLGFGSIATISRVLGHLEDAGFVNRTRRRDDAVFSWSDMEQVVKLSKIAEALVREKKTGAPRGAGKSAKAARVKRDRGTGGGDSDALV